MKKKLAIVVTHPIQYYTPVFKLLSERMILNIKVFYTWGKESMEPKFDPGFGKTIEWDIPLLDGYPYEFLENSSKTPGSHHFQGIINPNGIKRIKEFNPDAIFIYGWAYQSHFKIIRYFKGKIPIFFRGDSTLLNEQPGWKKYIRRLFLTFIYQHINKAFYVGTANRAYFRKNGLTENQLKFAPHSTDNERFGFPRTNEAQLLRAKLGISENNILILFAGKFEEVKNPLLLLKAFKMLSSKNASLLMVGNGVLESELKTLVEREKIEQVYFIDFQNQSYIPVVYQACDLFCLPSLSETWGLAINEVMAAGKAVIVSDKVGCSQDLVKDNGYIFKSNDLDDLASKLELLCRDKRSLQELGKKSFEIIKNWSFLEQVTMIERSLSND